MPKLQVPIRAKGPTFLWKGLGCELSQSGRSQWAESRWLVGSQTCHDPIKMWPFWAPRIKGRLSPPITVWCRWFAPRNGPKLSRFHQNVAILATRMKGRLSPPITVWCRWFAPRDGPKLSRSHQNVAILATRMKGRLSPPITVWWFPDLATVTIHAVLREMKVPMDQ